MSVWARGNKYELLLVITVLSFLEEAAGTSSSVGMKTSYACQGSTLSLSCPVDHVIKVMRANYGRFSVAICNEEGITDWSVNCMAPRSLRILQDRCNSEHECSITAESDNFGGDPCPGVPKYLEVYFGCFTESTTSTTTTPNPLPPWLTSRTPLHFFPGLLDLEIDPPAPRVPVTPLQEQTTVMVSDTETDDLVTVTPSVIEDSTKDIPDDVLEGFDNQTKISHYTSPRITTVTSTTETVETVTSTTPSSKVPKIQITSNVTSPEVQGRKETAKLVYTSERNHDTNVRIILSTLPPGSQSPEIPASISPHSDSISGLSMCPPRNIRALSWRWTRPGTEVTLSCPQGTNGVASWRCEAPTSTRSTPYWASPSPDLSNCQSVWMEKIITELRKSERVINLSSELMQYVTANALYGGDIKSAINAMTIMGEKMQHQLQSIPTMEQREAMVMELVQAITKTSSALLSTHNIPAWQDLPISQRTRFLSNLLSSLERTGSLLPGALGQDKEVSISSDNLLLTVRRISFRNIHRTQLPSAASLATPYWKNYTDNIQIPALVLMENMNTEGSQVVFLSLRNLERLLVVNDLENSGLDSSVRRQVVNCQVIHLSFGGSHKLEVISEPVSVRFKHSSVSNVTEPQCVMWDTRVQAWSDQYCSLESTNVTHTTCQCSRLGTFAVIEEVAVVDQVARITFLVMVIIVISVSIVVIISVILVFFYCQRIQVGNHLKLSLTRADIPCLRSKQKRWSLKASSTVTENLSQTDNSDVFDVVRGCDFMTLSQAALAAHDSPYNNQYNPGPKYQPRLQFPVQTQYIPGSQHNTTSQHIPTSQHNQSSHIIQTSQQNTTIQHLPTSHQILSYPSIPGPQVQNSTSLSYTSQPHMHVLKPHHLQDSFKAHHLVDPQGYTGTVVGSRMTGSPSPGHHIYMEVDPLYCTALTGEGEHHREHHCSGLASSTCSQTSSGYSTAPSDQLRHSRYVEGEEYEGVVQPDSSQGGGYQVTDRDYSHSHTCPHSHCHIEPQQQLQLQQQIQAQQQLHLHQQLQEQKQQRQPVLPMYQKQRF